MGGAGEEQAEDDYNPVTASRLAKQSRGSTRTRYPWIASPSGSR